MALIVPEGPSISDASQKALNALKLLSDSERVSSQDEDAENEPTTYSNELERLQIWMNQNGVSSGSLDHRLRDASHLRNGVLELLAEIYNLGADPAPPQALTPGHVSWTGSVVQSRTPSLDSDQEPLSVVRARPKGGSEGGSDSFSLDADAALSDSLPDSPASAIHDVIGLLFELSPSLLDPSPHDRSADPDAAQPDITHVRERFPNAPPELIERLGRSNWARRQALRKLRLAREDGPHRAPKLQKLDPSGQGGLLPPEPEKLDPSKIYLPDSESVTQESVASEISSSEYSAQGGRLTAGQSSVPVAKSVTTQTTLFSEPARPLQSIEALSMIESSRRLLQIDPKSQSTKKRYKVPLPPEGLTGRPFLCPFCSLTVSEIKSLSQWRKHITLDLEPYMCTYTDCILSAKTYASRQHWWDHESQRHRVQRSWTCTPCRSNKQPQSSFLTSKAFEQHVISFHPGQFTSLQIQHLKEVCRRDFEVQDPSKICPLCGDIITQKGSKTIERSVMKHIAIHLEDLAFFVAFPAGKLLSEEDDSELQDDSDSDDGIQSEIKSMISNDTRLSKKDIQLANVKSFLEAQRMAEYAARTSTPGLPIATNQQSGALDSPANETVPDLEPASLTFPIMSMMHPPNEHFYARQGLIQDADEVLNASGMICIFHGVGGIGKTLAGVEYIYTHKHQYDAIFWLQADTAPGLTHAYLQMVAALGLMSQTDDHITHTEEHDLAIDRGRSWLQETDRRWLLVFDNVIQWTDIARFLPKSVRQTRGSILITTQYEDLLAPADNVTKLQLDALDTQAGADMLLRYLNRDARSDPEANLAKEISAFVGGLPVAIAQIAGYVNISELSLEELIDVFRQWRRRVGVATSDADDLPAAFIAASTSHDEVLAMVWEVTLRELSQDARDVLNILAFLNCERVRQDMLWGIHEHPSLHFLDIREKFRMRRINDSLVKRRLVAKDAESSAFSMHRSLQRGLRERLSQDKNKQQEVFDNAVALVREVFPEPNPLQQPTPEKWSECQKLLPHLYALHDVYHDSRPHLKGSLEFAQLLMDAGMDQFERGIIKEGLQLLKTGEVVLDAISLEEHQVMRAQIHSMIAIMYDATGVENRQEAFERRKAALSIRKKTIENDETPRRQDEILLYNSWMEYAMSLLQYDQYQDAEPIIEKCLTKFREWGTEKEIPFEYAKYYNKIALVRMYQQRFGEAIKLATRAVQLMNQVGYSLFASRFKFDLACIVLQSGDVDRALRLHMEIYDQRVETVGVTNELTLHSLYAVGAIHELKANYKDAAAWYRAILEQRRSGTNWPDEAYGRTQFHLARVLVLQGGNEDLELAESLREKALRTLHRLLPLDTPTELEGVTDEAVLFDHLLPILPGGPRFTGLGLLAYFAPKP